MVPCGHCEPLNLHGWCTLFIAGTSTNSYVVYTESSLFLPLLFRSHRQSCHWHYYLINHGQWTPTGRRPCCRKYCPTLTGRRSYRRKYCFRWRPCLFPIRWQIKRNSIIIPSNKKEQHHHTISSKRQTNDHEHSNSWCNYDLVIFEHAIERTTVTNSPKHAAAEFWCCALFSFWLLIMTW